MLLSDDHRMERREESMSDTTFTLIDDGRPVALAARMAEGAVWLPAEAVRSALGRDPGGAGQPVALAALGARLERPLALDIEERAAYLGVAADARAAPLRALAAPDFTLPDLDGRPHSLAQHRGKKVFLVAYASW